MAPTRATRTTREDGSRSGQRRDRASLQGHRRARVRATAGQSATDSAAKSSAVTVLVHFRSIAQRLVNERFHTSIVATCRRTRAGPVPQSRTRARGRKRMDTHRDAHVGLLHDGVALIVELEGHRGVWDALELQLPRVEVHRCVLRGRRRYPGAHKLPRVREMRGRARGKGQRARARRARSGFRMVADGSRPLALYTPLSWLCMPNRLPSSTARRSAGERRARQTCFHTAYSVSGTCTRVRG